MNDPIAKPVRHVFGWFIFTLFVYITLFGACQIQRRRGGAWVLTFLETNGVPVLQIDHPKLLAEASVRLHFPGEKPERSDLPLTAVFTEPITNRMPFGPIVFVDTTQLPGTVTLNAFGHAIEMIPRTLFVDFKETPWTPGANLFLSTNNKPSAERLVFRGQQWRGR